MVSNSYATGSVSGNGKVGGLVGDDQSTGAVQNSYATGSVSGSSEVGGLVGDTTNDGNVTNSYWDTETSGRSTSDGGTGKTTAQLQAPTSNTGIYIPWSSTTWDFGTAGDYPILSWEGIVDYGTDYDTDDDNLIDINNQTQLNAIRWDRDGNGEVNPNDQTSYDNAFPNAEPRMGCKTACNGYELMLTINLDPDGNGNDPGDPFYNDGAGWLPPFASTTYPWVGIFEGNGHIIEGLNVNRISDYTGLFGVIGAAGVVRNVYMSNIDEIKGGDQTGGLAGRNEGSIVDSSINFSSGLILGERYTGGLVGFMTGTGSITASFAHVKVEGTNHDVGGLVAVCELGGQHHRQLRLEPRHSCT